MASRTGFEQSILEEIFGSPAIRQEPEDRWLVSYSEYSKSFGNCAVKLVLLPYSGEFRFSLSIGGTEVLHMSSAHQTASYAEIEDGKGFLVLRDHGSGYITVIRLMPDLFIGQTLGPDT